MIKLAQGDISLRERQQTTHFNRLYTGVKTMAMKSLVNFCVVMAVIIIFGSILLSAFTPKAPETTQKMVPLNQAGQVAALTSTALKLHPGPTGTLIPTAGKNQAAGQPTPAPTPRNANIIEQVVMNLLSPSSANGDGTPMDSTTLINLDQILASAKGKNLNQLFAGATDDQKRMIQQYSGGKNSSEMVSNFCRDVKSDSFKAMSQSVKANASDPSTDPHSPALLMLLFEKLGTLCP
jgi:hypothetical protein